MSGIQHIIRGKPTNNFVDKLLRQAGIASFAELENGMGDRNYGVMTRVRVNLRRRLALAFFEHFHILSRGQCLPEIQLNN